MLPPSVSNLTLKHPPTCLREGGGITEAAWRRGGPSAFSRRGRSVCGSDGAWSPRRTAAPLLLHFLEEKKHRHHCCSRTLGAFFTAGPWIPLWILGLLLRNNLLLMGAEPQRRGAGDPPGARAAPLLETRTGSANSDACAWIHPLQSRRPL